MVYAASSSAYGGASDPGGQREDLPVQPLSPYAAAKLAGELYCQAFAHTYGLETVRLRFFNIFGPRQRADSPYSGVIALFIAAMSAGKTADRSRRRLAIARLHLRDQRRAGADEGGRDARRVRQRL